MNKENKTLDEQQNGNDFIADVSTRLFERGKMKWRDDFGREMKEGDMVRIGSDVNECFVQGEYEYCYADAWGQYGLTDGGAFISVRKIKERGISLNVC